jgi:hypothetical protein
VGTHPDCGVYFASVKEPNKIGKLPLKFAENTATKIIGSIPPISAAAGEEWKVIIKTQYAGSGGILLKEPRTIESSFVLTSAHN